MDIIKIKDEQGNWTTMSAFQGQPGSVPDFSIGTVAVGSDASDAAASITGTRSNPILNLTIPKGTTGSRGDPGVYVGGTTPTDPDIKIWLDTSASNQSIVTSVNGQTGNVVINTVTSVNGQTGNVVLPVGVTSVNNKTGAVTLGAADIGATSLKLLWENADPSANFLEQTLVMDLSAYQAVMVCAAYATNVAFEGNNIVFVGDSGAVSVKNSNNNTLNGRLLQVSTVGISIGQGYTNGTANSKWAIPTKIYGIKGVQSI